MRTDQDGTIHLRQSDISTFIDCAEQYRRTNFTDAGRTESDAALVGTSAHALFAEEMTNGFFSDKNEALEWTLNFFHAEIASFEIMGTPYNRESFKTDDKASIYLSNVVHDWWYSEERMFLESQDPQDRLVEWNFDVPFTKIGDTEIWLTGTSDLVLPRRNQVWDWKTSSREYELWEKQRWAKQPDVYLYAAQHEGLIQPTEDDLYVFEYKVFLRGTLAEAGEGMPKPAETYRVYRSDASFRWLEKMVQNMLAMQLRLGTEQEWPLNDHSWACSPKWCPHFADCKGKLIDPTKNWT